MHISSMPYQQVIHPKYDWRGHESPSGYGPLSSMAEVSLADNGDILSEDIIILHFEKCNSGMPSLT